MRLQRTVPYTLVVDSDKKNVNETNSRNGRLYLLALCNLRPSQTRCISGSPSDRNPGPKWLTDGLAPTQTGKQQCNGCADYKTDSAACA